MVIELDWEEFDDHRENMLRHALAGFLRISPNLVKISAKEKGSIKLTIELPADSADELLNSYEQDPKRLEASLTSFRVRGVWRLGKLVHFRENPQVNSGAEYHGAGSVLNVDSLAVARELLPTPSLAAFEAALEEARSLVRQVLRRHRIPAQDAEDLEQEVLLALVHKWQKIEQRKILDWVTQTARNRCLIYWRRQRLESTHGIDLEYLELFSNSKALGRDEATARVALKDAFRSLSKEQRDLLRLYLLEGRSPAWIAERQKRNLRWVTEQIGLLMDHFARSLLN